MKYIEKPSHTLAVDTCAQSLGSCRWVLRAHRHRALQALGCPGWAKRDVPTSKDLGSELAASGPWPHPSQGPGHRMPEAGSCSQALLHLWSLTDRGLQFFGAFQLSR